MRTFLETIKNGFNQKLNKYHLPLSKFKKFVPITLSVLVLPVFLFIANFVIKKPTSLAPKAAVELPTTFTRSQIAGTLTKQFNLSLINPSNPTFADVLATNIYYQAVETFAANKITTGCASNPLRYCPDRIATRAEATTFLLRLFKQDNTEVNSAVAGFGDTAGHPLEKYIKIANQIGLISPCGKGATYFCPDDPIMSDQLQTFINKGDFILAKPQRWIQPNFHPDKFTVWETALAYPEMWDNTFKNVDVFGLFIYSVDANPYGYLDKVASVVKKYNLKTNVEMMGLMMTIPCIDPGTESGNLMLKLIQPLYDRGIQVNYISLDGSGLLNQGCPINSDNKVGELIKSMQTVHKVHPEIKFGFLPNFEWWDYQGTPDYFSATYNKVDDYADVFDNMISKIEAVGEKIHFVLVDNPYEYATGTTSTPPLSKVDWMQRIVHLENQVERKGMMFGLIYNDTSVKSDQAFYTKSLAFRDAYKNKGGTPGIAMIESWSRYPQVFVPDYKSYTFSNLVADFFGIPKSTSTRNLTRADAAVETANLLKWDLANPTVPTFSDVPISSPYFKQVETYKSKNITTGCAANPLRFCPDRLLTISEAITFLLRATGITPTLKGGVSFADVPSSFALYSYVIFAAENGISRGCDTAGNFCPNNTITLGEWENITTKVFDYYHSTKTCPTVTRCSTDTNGKEISYIPDHRTGCYDFKYFPIYPLWGRAVSCPAISDNICLNTQNCSVCKQTKSCCTKDLGLQGRTCQ